MTIPPSVSGAAQKVSDYVRNMVPFSRNTLTKDEQDLAAFLRGNQKLHDALWGMIHGFIEGRAKLPEPSDPLECKSMVAKDRELQRLLGRLEFIYCSPVSQEASGEPPA